MAGNFFRPPNWLLLLVGLLGLGLVGSLLAGTMGEDPGPGAIRLNNLGVAYMNQGRFERSLELFRRAQEKAPDLEALRLNQGIALLNLQRYEAAEKVLLQVARGPGENLRAWYNLGLLYRTVGRTEKALEAFERVAETDPQDADTQYFLGVLHTQKKNYARAVDHFQRALSRNPFHVSAEFGLARAYQRLGKTEQAREHLQRFRRLTQEDLANPMGPRYGEQGPYSLAQQIIPEQGLVPEAIPVRFVPAEEEAGLLFHHTGGRRDSSSPAAAGDELRVSFLGSGACFLDADRDGDQDVFLLNSGPRSLSAFYLNEGDGTFTENTRGAKLEARGFGLGCAAGDYDNDGWIDLVTTFADRIILFRNQGDGTFKDLTQPAGLNTRAPAPSPAFLDYDHDGDLDLYLPQTTESNLLWRNNGDGTFADLTDARRLQGAGAALAAVATDYNNDRGVDIVLTSWNQSPVLLENPRTGPFRAQRPWANAMPDTARGIAVFDYNKDGWMDLAFTHVGKPGLTLWRNQQGREFVQEALPADHWTGGWGVVALDYDNDGWIDLAAVGETGQCGEVRLFRNRGPEGFADVSAAAGLNTVVVAQPRGLITGDYDNDGDPDLLMTQVGGPVHLLRNDGGNKNHWLRVTLQGLADNKNGIGTKVEVFAGTLWQKWEVRAGGGYLGQSALPLTVGLGQNQQADIVRLLWPTGVPQDEIRLAARTPHGVTELDRKGSSCPILFAWNGRRFEFVTDVIGAGIVGHWVAPGQRNTPDPTEYVKVEGEKVRPHAGRLKFRFMEPMEEVVYLDQFRLLAIDHPAEVEIFPNEYFSPRPPFPSFKVFASRHARPPGGAWDGSGRDVLPLLRDRDRRYVADFPLLPFKGFAEVHALELELGERDPAKPLRLILHGFIDYFTATSVFAAHQAGIEPVPPYVEAKTADGRWVTVVDSMGFPAGLWRPMVVDLTGRLPSDARRIRLVTNLQIYWDQVLIDSTASESVSVSDVPLAAAALDFHGFPRTVEGSLPGDISYVYDQVSPTGPFARPAGAYTSYGDVLELVRRPDDRFAVFGPGEEIAVEFDATRSPPLRKGWVRDYLFYADGFVKDMDFYEAHPLTVGPLPFHAMDTYPPDSSDSYAAEASRMDYFLGYNDRHLTRAAAGNHYGFLPPASGEKKE